MKKSSSPTRLSSEQAREIQARNLRYRGLTNNGGSGIIRLENFNPLSDSDVVPVLRRESQDWINTLTTEEVRVIKKYTKNSGDPADNKFYARLNAMLRGKNPEDETLVYFSDVISGALRKNQLKHDIVCYRNMDINPYSGLPVGSVFSAKQFYSASVAKNGALEGKIQMVIYTHKGAKGAYIENLSRYPKQREFLFDKDSIFKILSNNGTTIEVEAIV